MTDRTGNMAATNLCTRRTRVLLSRPGIDQKLVSAAYRGENVAQGSALRMEPGGGERGLGDAGVALGHRPVFQLPLEVAAVQYVDLGMTKPGQQPRQKCRVDVARLAGAVDYD